MKKVSLNSRRHRLSLKIYVAILIFTLCMISVNMSMAQSNKKPRKLKVNGKEFKHIPRAESTLHSSALCNRLPNRTIDGTCNNITSEAKSYYGATDIELFREMYPAYGAPDFHNDMSVNCRITPRAISNIVIDQPNDILSPRDLSSLVFTWGQFLDHDISLTPEGHTEYMPILLPANESLFTSPIPFLRSEPMDGTGIDDPREQQNIITSWIDGSQIYGSEETRATWLRTFSQGKLKTSTGNLLPYNTLTGNLDSDIDPNAPSMAGDNGGVTKVFVAGDVRANEQPGLTSLHTLFLREHNRICDDLIQQGMSNDEQIYQRAKKTVGALLQSITYRGFLPALGVDLNSYQGYEDNVIPDISNIFATAAYRLGHTMVTNEIPLVDEDCELVANGSLALLDGFFDPSVVQTYDIHPILNGLASQTQQKVDAKVVDNLRNFLFPVPGGDPFGLDLPSLNIQRGRDHGLPDYNSVRVKYTGQAADDFSDITSDPDLQAALAEAYGNVYDMDLWVGLLSEDHLNNSSIGRTLNNILAKQFESLRDGDYYYYRNDPAFSGQQRDQIRNTTLRHIIERNTPVKDLQNNVFFAKDCDDNNGGGNDHGDGGNGGGNHPPRDNHGHRIVQPTNNMLSVSPNPTDGKININVQFEEVHEKIDIKIQNLDGKIIHQETTWFNGDVLYHGIDLGRLTPGIYFVSIQTKDKILTERIVLE